MDARIQQALQNLDRHLKGAAAAREELARLTESDQRQPEHP